MRNTRTDAALDAMRPYGFADNEICAAVNDLLKNVYGGDEGWFFIEDASYSVLIDRLIEVSTKKDASQDNGVAETSASGHSDEVVHEAVIDALHDIAMDPAPCSDEALNSKAPMSDTGVKGCNIPAAVKGEKREVSEHIKLERNSSLMCKPCHSWISDDDLDDLVDILPRAPLPEVLENLLSKMNETKKRKTRWDV